MTKKKLNIVVAGPVNSGLSTVSQIIKDALLSHGINATVEDLDGGVFPLNPTERQSRIRSVADKVEVVTITQKNVLSERQQ